MNTQIHTSSIYTIKSYLFYALLFFAVIGFSSCKDAPSNSLDVSDEKAVEDSFDALAEMQRVHGKIRTPAVSDEEFKVFDEIRHFGTPDMEEYGFTPIKGIYTNHLWGSKPGKLSQSSLPFQHLLEEQSKLAIEDNPDIAMIDIEHWPTSGGFSDTIVSESVSKYIHTYERFKSLNPDMKFGYYGEVPIRLSSGNPKANAFFKWRAANDRVQPMADKVDVFFLHSKTHWTNWQEWARSMKLNVYQARQMAKGKPVYVLLDPQYPASVYGASSSLHNKYVEGDFWRWQLNQARRFADGVMIWSHYGREWDESAPWWIETKKFLKKMDKY